MRIQHNIMAMNAYRNYNTNTSALSKNLEKLSSGYKINRAGDDAAGLAISEKMRAQITGLNAASKNVKDGISLVKTAEGAMQEIQDMLNRMDYLATQSANGTYDNDVDRKNLQKEVDQLRSEINRIADSANFNGIKLLDGKAGVNTTGFTSFENVAGVKGDDGTVGLTDKLAAATAGSPSIHLEGAAATQVNAEAVIDFSGLNITAEYTTSNVTADISLGSINLTVTLTGKTAYSASDIYTALTDAIKTSSTYGRSATTGTYDATSANNTAIQIGNNVYTFSNDNNNMKLTLAGVADDANGTNYKQVTATPGAATNEFDSDKAEEINGDLGFSVTVSGITGATGSSGDAVHMTTQVKQAVAHKDASKAGIDLTLDDSIVKQGYKLTIDGEEFTFELNDASVSGAGIINLAAESAAGQDIIHAAADKLSQQAEFGGDDGRKWKIGTTSDGKTIHIEQTKASDSGKEIKEYGDLTSKISVTGSGTADKGAGVKIGIDPAEVAAGNKLTFTLGDKSVELEVVESGANASKHQINKADIADATKWEAALGSDYTAELTTDSEGKQFITVRSKLTTQGVQSSVDASKAPVITGSGLVLQIGDTSESYNQLSVKIGDMHTAALGIDSLTIANPEGASAAIKTIRDAINQVSGVRGDLGATQNRLEHTANNLSVMAENIQDAESTIRDTDVAEEMMAYTKNNILIQSAQAMLAQANAVPQGVLQLLG